MKTAIKKIATKYAAASRKLYSVVSNPTSSQVNTALALTGVSVLAVGASADAFAATGYGWNYAANNAAASPGDLSQDGRIQEAVGRALALLEGSFGALIMVAAGLGAIISAAFGAYRAAVGLLVVAVGAFILRSLIGLFFNQGTTGAAAGGFIAGGTINTGAL